LNRNTGKLLWKWNNGSSVINYSPAACTPVIRDQTVFVVAPDRYLTAIDLQTGTTLWRSNESTVRESIGISEDSLLVYGKTMQDTIVAFPAQRNMATASWKLNAGYGYEHAPSMLLERNGVLFFGTRNGTVYAVNTGAKNIRWAYKIDNSMVNTIFLTGKNELLAATMDGKVVLLQERLSDDRDQPAKGSALPR
jgi:outer membrane protein assembly factor BamB